MTLTPENLTRLREIVGNYNAAVEAWDGHEGPAFDKATAAKDHYYRAFQPDTALALLDRIAALEAKVEVAKEYIRGEHYCGEPGVECDACDALKRME